MDFRILFEDQHIIVVEKPPKVPSQKDKTGDKDLLSMVKEYLIVTYPEAKDPYVALIHRLDRPVGGVMVFAKTKFASAKLSQQVQDKKMDKRYLGVVCGEIDCKEGQLRDYLVKNGATNLSKVVNKSTSNAKEAILEYKVLDACATDEGILSLVEIHLLTGRHHQIRVQTAHAGWSLWGDTKYNPVFSKRKDWTQIALWAYSLTLYHPKTNKPLTFHSYPNREYPFDLFSIGE